MAFPGFSVGGGVLKYLLIRDWVEDRPLLLVIVTKKIIGPKQLKSSLLWT